MNGWGTEDFKMDAISFFSNEKSVLMNSVTTEMEDWLRESGLRFWVSPEYDCVKPVFIETEDSQNEYEFVGYKVMFEQESDAVLFKLRWAGDETIA